MNRLHIISIVTTVLAILASNCLFAVNNTATKPFVVFVPGEELRVAVPSGDAELLRVAGMLAAEWETLLGYSPEVISGKGGRGDIILEVKKDRSLDKASGGSDEAYSLDISDRVRISGPAVKGVYWGTQTLLQMADGSADGSLPRGRIEDWPDYGIRGFTMDCGRKYIPMSYLRKLSRIMAYYKMNTLQIHLNDNGFKQYFGGDWDRTYAAFRLECDTYPGLTARDGHYTKAEFIDFQEESADMFVEIIPEIDVPAHSLALSRYMPEIGSQEYGMDHLDLFNPRTYGFVDALFKEYLEGDRPVFRGPRVHIGTDEYSNKDQEVVEQFRHFTDHYIRLVESYGKQAVVWGALTHADGETPVKSEGVLMNAWYNGYADPVQMAKDGYRLISIPDGLVYIVPAAGYYYDYLNEEYLYDNWTPAHVGDAVFPEKDPAIAGGMFAVWNDHAGNGISVKDIHYRLFPAMQTLAVKMWTGAETSLPYAQFDSARRRVKEAPGINFAGRIDLEPGCVLQADTVSPGSRLPYPEIGYDYTVSFTVEGRTEEPGTELFRSDDAVFYLSDPVSGMLGFARDGYLNVFRYRISEGEKAEIAITGDCRSTTLTVNGKVIDRLEIEKRWYNEGESVMYYVPTLVFPLKQAGKFSSRITDLKVYNYKR